MKRIVDDARLIFKCCTLYYEDRLGQQEICRLLGVSRPTVSRMLKLGRERGIVKIEVINPAAVEYSDLERQLEKTFCLQEAIVVGNSRLEAAGDHISRAVGSAVLTYLNRILEDGQYIGVTMGRSLQNVVTSPYNGGNPIHCTFVPIIGGVGENQLEMHSNYLVTKFAELYGASCLQFFSPALFSDKTVLEGFKREQSIRSIFAVFDRLDVVLVGIGVPSSTYSTVFYMDYVAQDMLEAFSAQGAVGDICLQYYDAVGGTAAFRPYNERVAGMELAALKKVPRRIGIVAGTQKAGAVLGAVRGGYVNTLITDAACAEAILQAAANCRREA